MDDVDSSKTFARVGIHRICKLAVEAAMGEANKERPSGHRHHAEPNPETIEHHQRVDHLLERILAAGGGAA